MKRYLPVICCTVIAVAVMICTSAMAQVAPPASTASPERGSSKVLPTFQVNDQTLEEVVEMLQKEDPALKVVLVRSPQSLPGLPRVRLVLKDVVAGDILNVIARAYPDVTLDVFRGQTGETIYVMRVNVLPKGGSGHSITDVYVYNLAPMVRTWAEQNHRAADGDPQKVLSQALDDIVSLIQAAVSLVDQDQGKPVIQVHASTQTLIFSGVPAQRAAVEQAMNALRPSTGNDPMSLQNQIHDLRKEVTDLRRLISQQNAGKPTTRP